MEIKVEVTETNIRDAVTAEVAKRVRERIPHHYDMVTARVDTMIRAVVGEVVAEMDIKPLIRPLIQASLDGILADTMRHQVKSLVRLAIHKELEAQKAEFRITEEGTS